MHWQRNRRVMSAGYEYFFRIHTRTPSTRKEVDTLGDTFCTLDSKRNIHLAVITANCKSKYYLLAMYLLAAASRPSVSTTVPKRFMVETSWYAFAKLNVNKDNIFLLYRINSSCKLFLSIDTFIILTIRVSA